MAGVEREAGRGQEPTLEAVVGCGGGHGAGCRRARGERSVRVESRDRAGSPCVFRGENERSVRVESREGAGSPCVFSGENEHCPGGESGAAETGRPCGWASGPRGAL